LSDVDGTLVDRHGVDERVKQAVLDFTRQGNWFSLATGRNAFAIRNLTDQLAVNAPCILLTGAALYDAKTER
jgi:hydroxymethylpyrimidine pyrophosphatase-like HAD family hydrolase